MIHLFDCVDPLDTKIITSRTEKLRFDPLQRLTSEVGSSH